MIHSRAFCRIASYRDKIGFRFVAAESQNTQHEAKH